MSTFIPWHPPGTCEACDQARRAAEPEPVRARLSPSPQRVWFEAAVYERWGAQ